MYFIYVQYIWLTHVLFLNVNYVLNMCITHALIFPIVEFTFPDI